MNLKTIGIVLVGTTLTLTALATEYENWTLSGNGKRPTDDTLEISGDGKGSGQWRSKPLDLKPGGFYKFSGSIRGVDSQGGCLPCGLSGFSRDYRARKDEWTDESFCFRLQDTVSNSFLRVGQWESKGTFQFRNIKLEPVTPILKEYDVQLASGKATLLLGDGETIRDGVYRSNVWLGGPGSNIQRPFHSSNVTFNSNRWCLYEGGQVIYRFELNPAIRFDGGTVAVGVCYRAPGAVGEGVVEISRDGKTRWTEIGRLTDPEVKEFTLPSIAFPLESLYLRIRGLKDSNFQVDSIRLEAPLAGDPNVKSLSAVGETLFATYTGTTPETPDELTLTTDGNIRANGTILPLPPPASSPGEIQRQFKVGDRNYTFTTQTHPLHRSDYGYALPAPSEIALWWAEADWKISRDRPAPDAGVAKPIEISVAKNDTEAFQLVVRGPAKGLAASVGALEGPDGTTIPAENVEVLYAYYHFVHAKTDGTGIVDFWPDALPPLTQPIDVEANKNQPLWIVVKVPTDAVAGKYKGTVQLSFGENRKVNVPFAVKVWNFALPKENHLETAFGFSPGLAAQYHNAKTDEDRRRVTEMYLQSFSDHRISIYRPTPHDNISVKWLPEENRCEVDFSRYEAEMERVLKKFNFTNFTVPGHGLGSGTFHSRTEPSLAGFGANTPQYKAMMTDYYAKLQKFLEDKGWLSKSYVYWFDEPGKHDYDFVAQGTATLQQYAPKINRFMTLMMDDEDFLEAMERVGTSINIWCPVSHHFQEELAKKRRALGERIWWYVCTGPKAPYCTLFIDHPATELRVWHWQAWQRNIVGTLIWESTYWHSGAAFPNSYQNPYEDPMGYVSGYSTPSGTRRHWGNGDGRFIYPPLSAAIPGLNDGKPIFDKPVSSIRWQMIREGVEDYEMLYLLRELLKTKGTQLSEADRQAAEELLTVPTSITKSMTEFTIDPRPLLERRNAVGAMIEKLR